MKLILNILATVEILVFLDKILHVRFSRNKIRLLIGGAILLYAKIFYTYWYDRNVAMILGNLMGPVVGAIIILDEGMIRNFLKYEFAAIYVCFLYMPFELILFVIKEIFSIEIVADIEKLSLCIVVILLMFFIAKILESHKWLISWIKEIPPAYYLIAIVYGFAVALVIKYIEMVMPDDDSALRIFMQIIMFILSIFMYVFGMGFALIDLLRKKHKSESELKDRYMDMLKNYSIEREKGFNEVRRMKHDMSAHLRALNCYAREGDYIALNEYLDEVNIHYKTLNASNINTGNVFVNGIITAEMQKAEGIELVCDGMLPKEVILSDYALSTIFSNLLINAIDACKRLEHSKRIIELTIKSDSEGFAVMLENPIEWELDNKKLGEDYTSKPDKDNHGYGLYNVNRIVEEYGGLVEISVDNGVFTVVVCIFYKK